MKEEVIIKLIQIQNQFRFLHWQTMSDAKHRAYGQMYEDFSDLIDKFAEACMGKHGRYDFEPEFGVMFQDIKRINVQDFLDSITDFLISLTDMYDPKYDSDLLNLRDEMLLLVNKLKYLLTLKY